MFCYARYHFQNREQLNQIENNIQDPKHKIPLFFRKLTFFVNISCITARYFWHGKWWRKYGEIWCNVNQKVATLLVYCSFFICVEHFSKARNRDLSFTRARHFLPFLTTFWLFKQFPVFIELMYFDFVWNRIITLSINILESSYTVVCSEE